jgi:hypothetical protein
MEKISLAVITVICFLVAIFATWGFTEVSDQFQNPHQIEASWGFVLLFALGGFGFFFSYKELVTRYS